MTSAPPMAHRLTLCLRRVESARERERQLAEVLRIVAAATRSGRSLQGALHDAAGRTTGSVSGHARRAAAQLALGVPMEQAIRGFAHEVGGSSAALFADVMAVQHRRGGDLGRLCHRLAGLLHERGRLDHEARAATAQARFTARAVLVLPLLVLVLWAYLSPATLRSMLTPAMLVVVSPALIAMLLGVLLVRSLARRALNQDAQNGEPSTTSVVDRCIRRVAGDGPVNLQARRLATGAIAGVGLVMVAGGVTMFMVVAGGAAVACALAWPRAQQRRRDRDIAAAVDLGLASLLELSIALLAAGAAPREVLVGAVEGASKPLRALMEPALSQISLGRSAASALVALPVTQHSPELDAWVHALNAGDEYGAPLGEVLETLLRDARSAERERFRARAAVMGPRMQLATVLLIVPAIMWLVLAATTNGLLRQLAAAGILGG